MNPTGVDIDPSASMNSSASFEEESLSDLGSQETIEEILEEEEGNVSLDDILQHKNVKIEQLEKAVKMKDSELILLRQQLNEMKAKQKEGVCWLQLELDEARRDKDATEEQMAELLNDLRGMTKLPDTVVSADVLKSIAIQNYEKALASMENQISMIKITAGEVVKTLKEEIADVMEDRANLEVDLLNQLMILDNEKSIQAAEFQEEIQQKNEIVSRLSAAGFSTSSVASIGLEEYETELARVIAEKRKIEGQLVREREESADRIRRLQNEVSRLERNLEAAEDDIAFCQSEGDAKERMQALERMGKEREEVTFSLDRAVAIWENTDATMTSLEDVMDKLKPTDDTAVQDDRGKLLSILETAALLHGQIKISILLIELRLRNQLQSLKNDRINLSPAVPCDEKTAERIKAVEAGVLNDLRQAEESLSQQIVDVQKKALEESKVMKEAIQKRSIALQSMKRECEQLDGEIRRLKSSSGTSSVTSPKSLGITNKDKEQIEGQMVPADDILKSPGELSEINGATGVLNGVSKSLVERLHLEVLRILQRVKEKNEMIKKLNIQIDGHKVTEEKLKNELKRAYRKSQAKQIAPSGGARDKVEDRGAKTHSSTSPVTSFQTSNTAPLSSPLISPSKPKKRFGTVVSPNDRVFSAPHITRPLSSRSKSSIRALKPSPREISKSRVTELLSPNSEARLGMPLVQQSHPPITLREDEDPIR